MREGYGEDILLQQKLDFFLILLCNICIMTSSKQQRSKVIDKCDRGDWIYILVRHFLCRKTHCKCKKGQLHDDEYVYKHRRCSPRRIRIGTLEEVGFPPKSDKDYYTALKVLDINDEVELFMTKLKKSIFLDDSLYTEFTLDLLKVDFHRLLVMKRALLSSDRKIVSKNDKGVWDTSNLDKEYRKVKESLKSSIALLCAKQPKQDVVPTKAVAKEISYVDLIASVMK